jgi:uncharacterized delta-60 repeat protein
MKPYFYRLATVLILLATLQIIASAASPGALDPTFDVDGKIAITNVVTVARKIAVQPDGKIIVVGSTANNADFVLFRFNLNGSPDFTFGIGGKVITDFGSTTEAATDIAVQADGRIVVAGSTAVDFAVARYNPNGSLDTTFDSDGKVLTDFAGNPDGANALVIQTDGKLVVAGEITTAAGGQDAGFARYNPNGSLDTTFSSDGKANFDIGNAFNSLAEVSQQPDGKIVAMGLVDINGGDFAVYRLDANGNLDSTFDFDGIVTTDVFGTDNATTIRVQPDSKILIGGGNSGPNSATLIRYNTNGSLDTTFDGDGRVTIDVPNVGRELISEIELQGDGKILACYDATINSVFGIGLSAMRFNSNGSLDTAFGNGGFVNARTLPLPEEALSMKLLSGNKMVVLGVNNNQTSFAVARYDLNQRPTAAADFDGDGNSDTAVFRPSTGNWFILQSSNNSVSIAQFGLNGDVPIDGDFDGDGRSDLAIFRPSSGVWFFLRSSDGTTLGAQFGQTGDKPIPGDYDKDGKTDIAFFRPSNSNWFILRSNSNFSTFFGFQFGAAGDIPISSEQK